MPAASPGAPAPEPALTASSSVGVNAGTERGSIDLTSWLNARTGCLVELWTHEVDARDLGNGTDAGRVVEMFARLIVRMLPPMVGPYRDQIQPLWDRAAELYGAIAAKRGLAAGEAIEELHILRELVVRELYRDPPGSGSVPLSLREFLRLNRSLDRAVTHASVGHTDALFFQFFEVDAGASAVLSGDDVAAEAESQLATLRAEMGEILRHAPWHMNGTEECDN